MAKKNEKIDNNEEIKQEEELDVKEETSSISVENAEGYIAKLNNDLLEQKQKADEYYDSLKRNMADFDNFKKRMIKEKESLRTMLLSDIVGDLLPILDNFETALSHKATDESFKEGMQMIYEQIQTTIFKLGVEEIPGVGSDFDPVHHEAVMHVDDKNYREKEVIEVLRKGYKLKDKVIRFAMVKVAN